MDPTDSRQQDLIIAEGRSVVGRVESNVGMPSGTAPSSDGPRGSVPVPAFLTGTAVPSSADSIADVPTQPAPPPTGLPAPEAPTAVPRSLTTGLVREARPRQWIKNLLVFVAPAAGGVLFHWTVLWHAAAAFGVFCMAASGTYFLNDAADAEADRLHPTKRFRPVAAGAVPLPLAYCVAAVLMGGAVGSAALLAGHDLAVVMALYVVINIAYSFGLKNEPILELALVSSGFVLRAIAGGVATGVVLSDWFIIVASFGSLLVVTGKRSGEQDLLNGTDVDDGSVRQTLALYSPEFLRAIRTLSAAVAVASYCLWAFEKRGQVHGAHHPVWFQLTIVPFVVGLLHVVRLLDSGAGAAPEELAIHDHRIQIYGLCWMALFAIGIYA